MYNFIDAVSGILFEEENVEVGYECDEPYDAFLENTCPEIDQTAFTFTPIITIILYGNDAEKLKRTISSIEAQSYSGWEIIVLSKTAYAYADSRIRAYGNETDISQAVAMSIGTFLLFMEAGDVISDFALAFLVNTMCDNPDADAFYSDEDLLSDGTRTAPIFKPDYAPDTLLSCNYIGRPFMVSRALYDICGGLRGFTPEDEYDFTLRACDGAAHIVHAQSVLYSRARAKTKPTTEKGVAAINGTLREKGTDGFAVCGLYEGSFHVHYLVPSNRRCCIVVYDADSADSLRNCLESIEEVTCSRSYSITVASRHTKDTKLIRYENALTNNAAAKVMRFAPDIPFAKMCNKCAFSTNADFYAFLPCSVYPLSPEWLDALSELALRRDTGLVSPLVVTHDNRVVSAGNVVGIQGWWGVPYYMEQIKYSDYRMNAFINTARNVTLSNTDCFMISNAAFSDLNGFDETFSGKSTIIDLSIRLLWKYKRSIYTPFVRMAGVENTFNRPDEQDELRAYDVLRSFLIHGDSNYNRAFDPALSVPTVSTNIYQAIKLNPMQSKN